MARGARKDASPRGDEDIEERERERRRVEAFVDMDTVLDPSKEVRSIMMHGLARKASSTAFQEGLRCEDPPSGIVARLSSASACDSEVHTIPGRSYPSILC